jgi:hypothetical protein
LTAYARPMPALGFDPAPGDVGLTRSLAQRQFEIAQELRQILTLIEHLDLSAWQGQTGDATRALAGTFAPALRNAVSAATELQGAASSWAGQLSQFQAEADALERKAAAANAEQQALQMQQAALPSRSVFLDREVETASARPSAIQRQAEELHERYLAASRATAARADEHPGLWDRTEPVRTVLEAVLAPLDIVAADHWVDALKEVAGVPADWVEELGQSITTIQNLRADGKSAVDELIEGGKLAEATGNKLDAWNAFAPGWLRTAAGSLAEIKGFSYTLTGLGVAADVGTVVSPQDKGVMGTVDRGAAISNGILLTLNATTDWVPGVGEVVIAVTGAYLAADYLYHHWTPFRDVANDIGHATVSVVEEQVDGDVQLAKDAGHIVSSGWHSVTSSIGSWF